MAHYGLPPLDDALPVIRQMLAQAAELEWTGGDREDDLALFCCVQLFSRGLLEDVLRIWQAKQSGFDLACSIDVQFLCRAGLEGRKEFLLDDRSIEANSALQSILSCEAAGDFAGWSPGHLANWQQYFGLNIKN